jgi:multidrug efflux system membrane fusion protein
VPCAEETWTPSQASRGVEALPPREGPGSVSSTPSENDPSPPRSGTSRRLRWIVLGAVAIVAFLYFVPIPFIAYTSDAYVRSDFVEVAPQVSGVVNHVDVVNDQKVAVGDLLATLDPESFALGVDLDQKRVDGAATAAKVREEDARVLASALETAKAAVTLAQQDYDRIAVLVKQGAVAQAILDRSVDDRQKALDAVTGVEARLRVNVAEVGSTLADVAVAKAQLALAQYNLAQTRLVASVPGFVTNLSLRPGDYAKAGVPIIGIVDDTQWRVVGNFKEYVAARLKPGGRAWIWLDSHPWRLFPARVFGVGRGVARHDDDQRLLPYVAPTTDWIRLSRRLQVTLLFDPMPDVPLFMGADARVLMFP